jgi:hypothetical protein
MRTEKLDAVCVKTTETSQEYYRVGFMDVTAVEWGRVLGHMDWLDTVRVFKNGELHSEHLFANVEGVYFAAGEGQTNG